ncbi:hypothetical protein Hanom_Chr02g00164021 [Helianthus anomalus]
MKPSHFFCSSSSSHSLEPLELWVIAVGLLMSQLDLTRLLFLPGGGSEPLWVLAKEVCIVCVIVVMVK